jgi:hypothetical protein
MEFKVQPIEVPEDDPFRFDALERRASVEMLTSLIEELQGPFVLAIDSPWGTGKTTFIKIWKTFLESKGFVCLHFNAWETDFTTDPLVAFLGEIDKLGNSIKTGKESFASYFEKTKKIATLLTKRALPVAGKIATGGLLDLEEFTKKALTDLVSDTINDAVDAYTAEKGLIEKFHESLTKSIEKLREKGKKDKLILFVDEVDRCRPTFAVELLERIKHLFNVSNAIFVISLDKRQLSVSLEAIYGIGINSEEYLRRFIDLEYALPPINAEAFTRNLFKRFGFDEFFVQRTHSAFRNEREALEKTFNVLSALVGLSLRAREQCFTRIRVAMMTTPENYHLYPLLLTTLVVLKVAAPEVYKRYAFEGGTAREVTEYLRTLKGGEEFLSSHLGTVAEVYLIMVKSTSSENNPEIRRYDEIRKNPSAAQAEKERAELIMKLISELSLRNEMPSLSYIVNKIELAAQFKM